MGLHTRRPTLGAERLESRRLLTGVVTAQVTGSVLTLVGDDLGNVLRFKVEPTILTLSPNKFTDVGKGPGVVSTIPLSTPLTAIRVSLAGGNDELRADGLAPLDLPGGITVALGGGINTLAIDTQSVINLGTVAVTGQDSTNSLTIRGAAGSRITGALSFVGSGGVSAQLQGFTQSGGPVSLRARQTATQTVSVAGVTSPSPWRLDCGAGLATLSLTDSTSLGLVTMTGESLQFAARSSQVAAARLDARAFVNAALDTSTVEQSLVLTTAAADGRVALESIVGPTRIGSVAITTRGRGSVINSTLAGDIAMGNATMAAIGPQSHINAGFIGAAASTIRLRASGVGSTVAAILTNLTATGGVSIASSAIGAATTTVDLAGSISAPSLSVTAGATALIRMNAATKLAIRDDIAIVSKTADSRFEVSGGVTCRTLTLAGDDAAMLSLSGTGSLATSGGLRASSPGTVDVTQDSTGVFTVAGDVSLAGAVVTRLRQGQPLPAAFERGVSMRGDTVDLAIEGTVTVGGSLSATASRLGTYRLLGGEIRGPASFSSGAGSGGVSSAFTCEAVRFAGSLSIEFGGGDNEFTFARVGAQSVVVGGALAIRTGNGRDRIVATGMVVSGTTTIDMSGGRDVVVLEDTTYDGAVSLRMGTGEDVLEAGASIGAALNPVTFNATLSADLGEDNDGMFLGRPGVVNAAVVFGGFGSRITGGRGRNTFNPATAVIVNPSNVTITDFMP